jgi:DHA1 family solute carrier family 18 vesicular amine transporter 1/2
MSVATKALLVCSLAVFVDSVLYYMLVPLIPELAVRASLTQLQIGSLFGSYAFCLIVSTVLAGRLQFSSGQRRPMLLAIAGLGIATILFALSSDFAVLLLARCVQGVAAGFTWVLGLALVIAYFPGDKRGAALGVTFSVANAGYLLGPPIGGFLLSWFGYLAPFIFGIIVVVIDGAARYFLLPEVHAHPEPNDISWRDLLRERSAPLLVCSMGLGAAAFAMLDVVLPLYLHDAFAATPDVIGALFVALGSTFVFTSPMIGRLADRFGYAKALCMGHVLTALLIMGPLLASSLWQMAFVLVFLGLFSNLVFAPCQPGMASVVDAKQSTHYAVGVSLLSTSYSVGMMAGAYLGSFVAEYFGLQAVMVGASILFLGSAVWSCVIVRGGSR